MLIAYLLYIEGCGMKLHVTIQRELFAVLRYIA